MNYGFFRELYTILPKATVPTMIAPGMHISCIQEVPPI